MTLDMYAAPRKMVEEISAIGLRHVGYAIPVEMPLGERWSLFRTMKLANVSRCCGRSLCSFLREVAGA